MVVEVELAELADAETRRGKCEDAGPMKEEYLDEAEQKLVVDHVVGIFAL